MDLSRANHVLLYMYPCVHMIVYMRNNNLVPVFMAWLQLSLNKMTRKKLFKNKFDGNSQTRARFNDICSHQREWSLSDTSAV